MKPPKNKSRKVQKKVACFQVLEDECIWMKAGVVNFRICDNAYDCQTCGFNNGIMKAMMIDESTDAREIAPQWVTHLTQQYGGDDRPCRHALTGRISAPKICVHNYECHHCEFDQMLDNMDLTEDFGAPRYRQVAGFRIAEDYYYHPGHCWVRFEHGGRARVGLDDFASRLFGAMTAIELPPLGERLMRDRVGWAFRRESYPAAVLSPITGTVLANNHGVGEHPQIVGEDPYHQGWLFIVEPDMPKQNLKGLYFGAQNDHWIEHESRKLLRLTDAGYETLAPTGAMAVRDIYGTIPGLQWEVLVSQFLHTIRH